MDDLIATMVSTAQGLKHAANMIDAGEVPQASAIRLCASHADEASTELAALKAKVEALENRPVVASADYLEGVRAGLEAAAKVCEQWHELSPYSSRAQAIRSLDPETLK